MRRHESACKVTEHLPRSIELDDKQLEIASKLDRRIADHAPASRGRHGAPWFF
jgi:hypothetical protein